MPTDETTGARMLRALAELVDVAGEVTPEDVDAVCGDASVTENFYRDWPVVRDWAEPIYRRMESELGRASLPDDDPDSPETGTRD
jgi:hypothetical protein